MVPSCSKPYGFCNPQTRRGNKTYHPALSSLTRVGFAVKECRLPDIESGVVLECDRQIDKIDTISYSDGCINEMVNSGITASVLIFYMVLNINESD